MDNQRADVPKKLEELLKQTIDAAVELSRFDGPVEEVPHYSVIKLYVH